MSLSRETRESSSHNTFGTSSRGGANLDASFRSREEEDPFASRDESDDAFASCDSMDGAFETSSSNAFMSSSLSAAAGILGSAGKLGVQAKLKVGSPEDELEKEADQVADTVMRMPEAPLDEPNKEPCETGACPSEEEKKEGILPKLKSDGQIIQRQEAIPGAEPAATNTTADAADTTATAADTGTEKKAESGLIVENSSEELEAGQMKKSVFLRSLKTSVKSTVASALKGTGKEEEGLLAVETRFKTSTGKSATELEKQIKAEVPGASGVKSAQGYIEKISAQVRFKVTAWVQSGMAGEMPNIPGAGVIADMMAATDTAGEAVESGVEALGSAVKAGTQAVGSAVKSAAKSIGSFFGSLFSKSKDSGGKNSGSPQAIQSQLGEGAPLDAGTRGRMESAFGTNFSNVRMHNDTSASNLSSDLNARAFTVGDHVAFGSGEYQPGTPVGDALIAHELAHTVQQSSGGAAMAKGAGDEGSLETDADDAAVGAMMKLSSGGALGELSGMGRSSGTALKTGLRLQRCGTSKPQIPTPVPGASGPSSEAPTPETSANAPEPGTSVSAPEPETSASAPPPAPACSGQFEIDTASVVPTVSGPDMSKSRAALGGRWGMVNHQINITGKISRTAYPIPNQKDGWIVKLDKVSLDFFLNHKIYLAKKLKENDCLKEAVEAHERRHIPDANELMEKHRERSIQEVQADQTFCSETVCNSKKEAANALAQTDISDRLVSIRGIAQKNAKCEIEQKNYERDLEEYPTVFDVCSEEEKFKDGTRPAAGVAIKPECDPNQQYPREK